MKKVIAIICTVIIICGAAFAISSITKHNREFTISIDPDKVAYAELRISNEGHNETLTITMDDDRETLVSLITAFNGKYRLYDKMDVPDGDVTDSIYFFDADGNEICSYAVGTDNMVYIYHEKSLFEKPAKFYRYKNTEQNLDFSLEDFFSH